MLTVDAFVVHDSDDTWWRDLLRGYVVFSSPFYILSSMVAIAVNHRKIGN